MVKSKTEITPEQIAVAHRIVGRPSKRRPIIVRIEQPDVKSATLKQRRQLKDTGMSIHEDLVKAVWDKLGAIKEKEEPVDVEQQNVYQDPQGQDSQMYLWNTHSRLRRLLLLLSN